MNWCGSVSGAASAPPKHKIWYGDRFIAFTLSVVEVYRAVNALVLGIHGLLLLATWMPYGVEC